MTSRRNLVVLMAHGLRSDAVSDSQAWPLRTPSLEMLAARGLRVVASSACPSDPGGAVSLLTGYHARQHGHLQKSNGPASCEGWPAQMVEAGYHVAGVGLVGLIEPWLSQVVLVDDVATMDSPRCQYMQKMRTDGYSAAIQMQRRQRIRMGPFDPDRLLLEPDADIDGFIALEAKRLLGDMPDDRPWVLIVSFSGPGNDLPPPAMYESVVDVRALENDFSLADFTQVDSMAELDFPRVMLQRLEPQRIARVRADYLGRVSLIDHAAGVLSTALAERADSGRTWTVVCADRGQLLGEHGLVGHRSFLAGALETPAIITPPPARLGNSRVASAEDAASLEGMDIAPPDQRVFDGLASTVDVAATVAAIVGCDLPPAATGRSLLPALSGDTVPRTPGGIISEFGKRLMLETDRYKVIFDAETRRPLGLYDLLDDPGERRNLSDTPVGSNLFDALRWRLGDALIGLRARPM